MGTRTRVGKERKDLGYKVKSGPGLGNTTVRGLLSDERYAEAVLGFCGRLRWGWSKMEFLLRGKRGFLFRFCSSFLSSSFFISLLLSFLFSLSFSSFPPSS